jgi:hypothetical protein
MITGTQYFRLLGNLCHVAEEAGMPVQQKGELDQCQQDPYFAKAFESFPPSSIDAVAKKVKEFVANNLIAYEAANRTQLPYLAKHCVLQWQDELDREMQSLFKKGLDSHSFTLFDGHLGTSFEDLTKPEYEEMEKKLNELAAKILCPKFQSPVHAELELAQGLTHIFAKELIRMKFSEHPSETIPRHVRSLLGKLSLNPCESFLIKKYGVLLKKITFHDVDKLTVHDGLLIKYLERCPNVNYLDVSHCMELTPACFKQGHNGIETLVLTGTSIEAFMIDRSLFPKLKTIEQEKVRKVFNLNQLLQSELFFSNRLPPKSWTNIKKQSEVADLVLIDKNNMHQLSTIFQASPNQESLDALLALEECLIRSENCNACEFNKTFSMACIRVWRTRPSEDWKTPKSFGQRVLNLLIERWSGSSKNEKFDNSLISRAFYEGITATYRVGTHEDLGRDKEITVSYPVHPHAMGIIRHLMRELRGIESPKFEEIARCVSARIKDLDSQLFFKKKTTSLEKRDCDVTAKEFMNEIYVELSGRFPELASPFAELEDPYKVTKKMRVIHGNDAMIMFDIMEDATPLETATPGPLYHEAADQSLACAFVLETSPANREKLLRNLLFNFSDYISKNSYYSLAKIVLGTVREKDIPPEDLDNLLTGPLLKYRGVFSEEIDPELKEQFWKALCEGKLGGITIELIDGLVDFYFSETTDKHWKEKVEGALKFMGGILFTDFIANHKYANMLADDPIKQYARKRLSELFQGT